MNVCAEVTGSVWTVEHAVGDTVKEGDVVMVIESMKMEIPAVSPCDGTIAAIERSAGEAVAEGDLLFVMDED